MCDQLVQNAGYELIPAPPSIGTAVTSSGTANTWSSWTQLVASLSNDNYLIGIAVNLNLASRSTPKYLDVQIGTGASGSESSVTTIAAPVSVNPTQSAGMQAVVIRPMPVFLQAGKRVAARIGEDLATGPDCSIVLIVVQTSNIVSGGNMAKPNTVLAQNSPSANTVTDLFTTTDTRGLGYVMVNNTNATPVNVFVSFAPGGAADTASQYLYSNIAVGPGATMNLPLGIVPASGDKVRVKATASGVVFALMSS